MRAKILPCRATYVWKIYGTTSWWWRQLVWNELWWCVPENVFADNSVKKDKPGKRVCKIVPCPLLPPPEKYYEASKVDLSRGILHYNVAQAFQLVLQKMKIFGNQMIMVIISLVRERNGGRGSFAATLLNPNVENEGHSHTGPRYFETISGSG